MTQENVDQRPIGRGPYTPSRSYVIKADRSGVGPYATEAPLIPVAGGVPEFGNAEQVAALVTAQRKKIETEEALCQSESVHYYQNPRPTHADSNLRRALALPPL